MMVDPTTRTYSALTQAYAFFNAELFDGELPPCLITMQRKAKCYGYFASKRFGTKDGSEVTDEIAMNPQFFNKITLEDNLSTLVHEMAHLWQFHFGKPSKNAYHNKEWAEKMMAIGLYPSHTGLPGGRTTGQKMNHYVIDGARFSVAFTTLVGRGFTELYADLWDDEERKKKAASKTKYICASCECNAWAKPNTNLRCGDCDEQMVALRPGG